MATDQVGSGSPAHSRTPSFCKTTYSATRYTRFGEDEANEVYQHVKSLAPNEMLLKYALRAPMYVATSQYIAIRIKKRACYVIYFLSDVCRSIDLKVLTRFATISMYVQVTILCTAFDPYNYP